LTFQKLDFSCRRKFGADLIWRRGKNIKFGADLIWRRGEKI